MFEGVELPDGSGCIRAATDHRRSDGSDHRQEEQADESGDTQKHDSGLKAEAAYAYVERSREMLEPRPERRNARPDRELVHHEERGADADVCPDNASQARGERCKDRNLDDDAAGNDPGVPCLASREVVADQDVSNREQTDRKSKGSKHAASLGEVLAKCRRDEPWARGRVEEHEQPTERGSGEQRTSEDVLRLLAARLTRGCARKQNRQDRPGQKEA